jgi:ABC-type sugar transport system permease subunit
LGDAQGVTAASATAAGRRWRFRAASPTRLAAAGPWALPAVALVAVLLYAPFLWTVVLSFTRFDGLNNPSFVGLRNYADFIGDPVAPIALRNTLLWVAGALVLPVGLGLLVAALTWDLRHGTLYRLPFLLPYAFSGAGVAVVWGYIFQPQGAANAVLSLLGLPGGHTSLLLYGPGNTIALIVASAWQQVGVNALLFVVGLQSLPREPLEAARLDGAGELQLFRHVTWPLLRPLAAVVIGLALVASLKTFDVVWVMTQGGPGNSSETLAVTMYKQTFVANAYGYGSAIAVLLTVVTGLATITYLRWQVRSR